MKRALRVLISFLLLCKTGVAAPGDIDTSFDSGIGTSTVQSAVSLKDRSVFIGGNVSYGSPEDTYDILTKLRGHGAMDLSFSPRLSTRNGYDGTAVRATATDTQGRLLIAGTFDHIDGTPRRFIARMERTGDLDLSFDPVVDKDVNCIVVQPDGKILIGGEFSSVGGHYSPYMARLNEDGSPDQSFSPLAGDGTEVTCVEWLKDRKILIAATSFQTSSGVTRRGLVRLLADGTLDPGFNPPLTAGSTDALAVQSDGKVVAAGWFTSTTPATQTEILRFHDDGSVDTTFLPNFERTGTTPGTGTVGALALQEDGRIVAGGYFDKLNSSTLRKYIVRLNTNGSLDGSFNSTVQNGTFRLFHQPGGDFLVSGSRLNTAPFTKFYRLTNSSSDSLTFPSAGTIRWSRGSTAAAIQGVEFSACENGVWQHLGNGTRTANGWELSGVTFPVNGVVRARPVNVSQWNLEQLAVIGTASSEITIRDAAGSAVVSDQVIDFGNLWIGATKTLNFEITNTGSGIVTPFLTPPFGTNPTNFALSGFPAFEMAPGEKRTFTIKFTPEAGGLREANLQFGIIQSSNILPLSLRGVAGATPVPLFASPQSPPAFTARGFTTTDKTLGAVILGFHPQPHTELILVNNTGVQRNWTSLPTPNFPITGVFPNFPDKAVIPLEYEGQSYPFTVSYTGGDGNDLTLTLDGHGTRDPVFNTTIDSPLNIWKRTVFLPDGRYLVCGLFRDVAGVKRIGIARFRPDGSLDPTFDYPGGVEATAIALEKDGSVLIAGTFENESASGAIAIARLAPDGRINDFLVRSINGLVNSLIVRPDGRILAVGDFTTFAGQSRSRIVLIHPDGSLDTGYQPAPDGQLLGGSLQADGGLIIHGSFTKVGATNRMRIARLNSDGSLDTDFDPLLKARTSKSNPVVQTTALLPDGDILVGGSFVEVDGVRRDNLVRLNADGTVDENFQAGLTGSVSTIIPLQDGRVIVGGYLTNVGTFRTHNAARFHPDGTVDTSFFVKAGTAQGLEGIMRDGGLLLRDGGRLYNTTGVSTLEVQTGNKLVWHRSDALGEITTPRMEARRPDDATWTLLGTPVKVPGGWELSGVSFPPEGVARAIGSGPDSDDPRPADEAVLGFGPASAGIVIRKPAGDIISNGGSVDFGSKTVFESTSLNIVVGNTGPTTISDLTFSISGTNASEFILEGLSGNSIPPFGSILARVRFSPNASGAKNAILRITSNAGAIAAETSLTGTGGTAFSPVIERYVDTFNLPVGLTLAPYTLETFTLGFQPVAGRNITLIRSGPGLGTFSNAPAGAMVYGNYRGTLYYFRIGYNSPSSSERNVVLTYLPFGSADSTFNAAANSSVGDAVAVQADGKIIVSGSFTQIGGQAHQRLARIENNGSADHDFRPAVDGLVENIALDSNGRILLVGSFTIVNGINRRGVARLNADGTLDESFNANLNNSATRIVVLPDGGCYLAGPFASAGGLQRFGIVRLLPDGSADGNFNAGLTSSSSYFFSLAVQEDGKVLLGGEFNLPGGSKSYFSRFLADGTVDSTFTAAPNSAVSAITRDRSGKLLIGGHFGMIGTEPRIKIARLNADGSLDPTFLLPNGADLAVACIALQSDGKMIISGQFSTVDGLPRPALARLQADGAVDTGFVPGGSSSFIKSVAFTNDGNVIVSGNFSSIGGASRNEIAKLLLEPASEQFLVSPDQIQWNRGDPFAELNAVVFSSSPDGKIWTPLGNGSRNASGWSLTGITPPAGFIRAEGRHSVSNRGFGLARKTLLFDRTMTAIEQWRQTKFGSPLNEGHGADNGDSDFDGSKNLVEYAFNLNPSDPASRLTTDWTRTGDHHEISLPLPVGITGVDYDAEWSTSMKPDEWYPAEDMRDPETLKFRVFSADKPNLFLRLKVVRP